MMRFFTNDKGVTLMELLVVLAIMSMIGALILSINLFGMKSFKKGSNQADLQQNVRIANEVIKKDLRNAKEILFIEKASFVNPKDDKGFKKILKLDANTLYQIDTKPGGQTEKALTGRVIEDIVFSVKYEYGKYILFFEIKAGKEGQMYSLKNQIILYNLRKNDTNDKFIGNTYSIKSHNLLYNIGL